MYKRILIIGFRCVGKSSISKQLSKLLNIKAIDMDSAIEQEQNKSIKDIVDNGKNWKIFRQLEFEKLQQLLKIENIIISAGGGLGVNNIKYTTNNSNNETKNANNINPNNLTYGDLQRKLILESKDTFKILLFANENTIRKRLYKDKINGKHRTDLNKVSSNMNEYIENNITIMKEREKYYQQMADIKFDTSNRNEIDNSRKLFKLLSNIKTMLP